jgi:hypothetical protein
MGADIVIKSMPGESLYSLVARLARVNGYKPDIACKLLLGEDFTPRVADAKVNLSNFLKATHDLYGDKSEVVHNHTNLTFRSAVTTPLLDSKNSNKWNRLISSSKLTLAAVSNHEEHLWRWCSECIEEDFKTLGFTYWRSHHQLPGVFVCTTHQTSLNEITLPYRQRQSSFFLPDNLPKHIPIRQKCPSDTSCELATKLSQISDGIGSIPDQKIDQMSFRLTMKNGLKFKGLLTRNGSINQEAYSAFKEFYKSLAGIDEVRSLLGSRTLNKQIDATLVNLEASITKPIVVPMLILWLYGSWKLFRNTYDWERTMSSTKINQHAFPLPKTHLSKEDHRKICIQFIRENPNALRTDFWGCHPQSCRWLSHFDQEWLERSLSSLRHKQYKQFKLFK